MTELGGESSLQGPFIEPICLDGPQSSSLRRGFLARVGEAAHKDLEGLSLLGKTKAGTHAIGVATAYAYQLVPATAIGVAALVEGYSRDGWVGAIDTGLFVGGVVGAQHLVAGENAVEAATAYPRTGRVIREQYPRVAETIADYWEANHGPVSGGAAVSSVGIQSAIYNHAYNVAPGLPKPELRHFAHRAMVKGTVFTTGMGVAAGSVGKGLQTLAVRSNNHVVDVMNRGFDREIIDRPVRTTGAVLLFTLGNSVKKIIKNRHEQRNDLNGRGTWNRTTI